jgi:hypothetical protein
MTHRTDTASAKELNVGDSMCSVNSVGIFL